MVFDRWLWQLFALLIARSCAQIVSDMEWGHFNLVNQLRAAGFSCPGGSSYPPNSQPLVFECKLWKASQLHSEDMAVNNYFAHNSQDGRTPWQRASAVGAQANAENIAAGASTAEAALTQWKNSDGHCKNMGNAGLRSFGVGYGYNSGSDFKHYWTQMFGGSSAGADTSCYPGAAPATTTGQERATTNTANTATATGTVTATGTTATATGTTAQSANSPGSQGIVAGATQFKCFRIPVLLFVAAVSVVHELYVP